MAQPFIILRNRDRFRRFQISLYHSIVCVTGGRCICLKQERPEADRKGETTLVEQTLDLPPLHESSPLPHTVLNVPQVAAALQSKWLEELPALAEIEVVKSTKE